VGPRVVLAYTRTLESMAERVEIGCPGDARAALARECPLGCWLAWLEVGEAPDVTLRPLPV